MTIFKDTQANNENRFSIGIEMETGCHYLSIPVSNRNVDYEEHYQISKEQHDGYPENLNELIEFAENCRNHLNDNLLFHAPGSDRGVG